VEPSQKARFLASLAPHSGDWLLSLVSSLLLLLSLFSFLAHQRKAAGVKKKLTKNNDHDTVSHGVECSQEGDHIPPLKSNRQALEQEHRLSCVLRDCSDASTNFFDPLYSGLVSGAGIIIIIIFIFTTGAIVITYKQAEKN